MNVATLISQANAMQLKDRQMLIREVQKSVDLELNDSIDISPREAFTPSEKKVIQSRDDEYRADPSVAINFDELEEPLRLRKR